MGGLVSLLGDLRVSNIRSSARSLPKGTPPPPPPPPLLLLLLLLC